MSWAIDPESLYVAIDKKRRESRISLRKAADLIGISASSLTRIGQGHRPDVDGFASIVKWLEIPSENFFRQRTE